MAFRVGGDFFKPANGRYVGQFYGVRDGKPMTYTDKLEDGTTRTKTGNTMIWMFGLYNLDGTPVIDPKKPGEVAVGEGMSSDSVGVGRGTVAKARVWLTKMLESKGSAWVDPQDNDAVGAMVAFCQGVYVYLTFGKNTKGADGTLLEIERMQQPQVAAPVAPPPVTFAAPAPVTAATAPAFPVAAPVPAAAPQAIPVQPPVFVPATLPIPSTTAGGPTSIPSMPFPTASA